MRQLVTHYKEAPSQRIRVLVANLPNIWQRFIAENLKGHPDIVVIDFVTGNLKTLSVAREQPDVIILGADQAVSLPGICTHLLTEFPQVRIMALVTSNDLLVAYWMGLKRQELALESMADLPQRIREVYQLDSLKE